MMRKIVLIPGAIVAFALLSFTLMVSGVKVGDKAPAFKLKSTNGDMVQLSSQNTEGAIVIFSCNHCPYSKAYEDRIIALDKKYKDSFPVIMINSNDPVAYPSDDFDHMKIRAAEKKFTFPYLIDETQEIAKQYGALKTPHVYLVHKENGSHVVKYMGAIDDNTYNASKVKKHYLEDAISNVKKGEKVSVTETKAIGCGIKWKN